MLGFSSLLCIFESLINVLLKRCSPATHSLWGWCQWASPSRSLEPLPGVLGKQNKPQALPIFPAQVCLLPLTPPSGACGKAEAGGKIIATSCGPYESHTPSVIPQTPNLPFQAEACVEPKVQLSKPVRRLIPPPALIGVQKS